MEHEKIKTLRSDILKELNLVFEGVLENKIIAYKKYIKCCLNIIKIHRICKINTPTDFNKLPFKNSDLKIYNSSPVIWYVLSKIDFESVNVSYLENYFQKRSENTLNVFVNSLGINFFQVVINIIKEHDISSEEHNWCLNAIKDIINSLTSEFGYYDLIDIYKIILFDSHTKKISDTIIYLIKNKHINSIQKIFDYLPMVLNITKDYESKEPYSPENNLDDYNYYKFFRCLVRNSLYVKITTHAHETIKQKIISDIRNKCYYTVDFDFQQYRLYWDNLPVIFNDKIITLFYLYVSEQYENIRDNSGSVLSPRCLYNIHKSIFRRFSNKNQNTFRSVIIHSLNKFQKQFVIYVILMNLILLFLLKSHDLC